MGNTVARSHIRDTDRGVAKATRANTRRNSAFTQQVNNPPSPTDSSAMLVTYPPQLLPLNPGSTLDSPDSPPNYQQPHLPSTFANPKLGLSRPDPPLDPPLPPRAIRQRPVEEAGERVSQTKRRQRHVSADIAFSRSMSVSSSLPRDTRSSRSNSSSAVHPSSVDARIGRETPRFRDRDDPSALRRIPSHSPPPSTTFSSSSSSPQSVPNYASLLSANPSKIDAAVAAAAEARTSSVLESTAYHSQFSHSRFHRPTDSHALSPFRRSNIQIDPSLLGTTVRDCQTARTQTPPRVDKPPHARKVVSFNENVHIVTYPYESSDTYSSNSDIPSVTRFSDLKQPRRRGRSMFRLLSRSSNTSENDSLTSETLNFQYDLCGSLPPESDTQAVYDRLVPSHSASISSSGSPAHDLMPSAYDATEQQPLIIAYENPETRSSVSKPSDPIEGAVTDDYDYTDRKELENADTLSLSDAHLSCDGIEEPEAIVDQLFSQSRENAMDPRASTSFDIAPLWQRLKRVDELDAVDLARRSFGSAEKPISVRSDLKVGSSSKHHHGNATNDAEQVSTFSLSRQSQNLLKTEPSPTRDKNLSEIECSRSDVSETQISNRGHLTFPSRSASSRNEQMGATAATPIPSPASDFTPLGSADNGSRNVGLSDRKGSAANTPYFPISGNADYKLKKRDSLGEFNLGSHEDEDQSTTEARSRGTTCSSALVEIAPKLHTSIANSKYNLGLNQTPQPETGHTGNDVIPKMTDVSTPRNTQVPETEKAEFERTRPPSKVSGEIQNQTIEPMLRTGKFSQKLSGHGDSSDDYTVQAEDTPTSIEDVMPKQKTDISEQNSCEFRQFPGEEKQEFSLDKPTCRHDRHSKDTNVHVNDADDEPCRLDERALHAAVQGREECQKGLKFNWKVQTETQKSVKIRDTDSTKDIHGAQRETLDNSRPLSTDTNSRVDTLFSQRKNVWDSEHLVDKSSGSLELPDVAEDMSGRIGFGLKIDVPANATTNNTTDKKDHLPEIFEPQLPYASEEKHPICQAIFRGQELNTDREPADRKSTDELKGTPVNMLTDSTIIRTSDRKLPLLGSSSSDTLSKKISSSVYMGELKDKSLERSVALERSPSNLSDNGQRVSVSSAVSKIEQSTVRDATAAIGNTRTRVRRRKKISNVQPLAHMLSSGHSSSSSVPSQDGGVSVASRDEDDQAEISDRDIGSIGSDGDSLSDLDLNGIRLSSHDDYSVNTSGLNRSYSPLAGVYYGTSSPSLIDQLSHDTEIGRNEGRASYPEYELLKGKEDSVFDSEPDTALGDCGEWASIDAKDACGLEIDFDEGRIQTKLGSRRISSQDTERDVPEVLLHEWSGNTPVEPNIEMEDSASSSSSSLQVFNDKQVKDRDVGRSVRLSSKKLGVGLSKLYGRSLECNENDDRDVKLVTLDKKTIPGESSRNRDSKDSESRGDCGAATERINSLKRRNDKEGRGSSDHGMPNQGNYSETWISAYEGDKSQTGSLDNRDEASNEGKAFFAALPNGYAVDPKLQDFQMSVQRKSISEIGYRRSGRATGRGASFVEGEYRQLENEGAVEMETRVLPKEVKNEVSLRRRTGAQRRRRLSNVETSDGLNRGHEGLAFRGVMGRLVSGMHLAKKLVIPN